MSLQAVGMSLLWFFLFIYIIISSIDFGAGFYIYYARWRKKERKLVDFIRHYLSSLWEITSILFIFFAVGITALFPSMSYYYGTAFVIPSAIAMLLMMIRSSYYAFESYGSKDNQLYMFMYGVTGLLIPASFSTALTISEGGFIKEQGEEVIFLAKELFTSMYSWSVVILAVVSVLFISACFLTYYASRAHDEKSMETLRRFSLFWSIPTIFSGFFVFIAMKGHNERHFQNMVDIRWLFVISFLCFCIGVVLIYQKKYLRLSFIMIVCQFFLVFFGYGIGHLPYILEPYITISNHGTSDMTKVALFIIFSLGIGFIISSICFIVMISRKSRQGVGNNQS